MTGIVLRDQKLVYWPVPKNACTAIKTHIARRLGLEFSNPHTAPFERTSRPIQGFANVAIVRHPLKRLYSLWANKVAEGHTPAAEEVNGLDKNVFAVYGQKFRSGMTFGEFVQTIIVLPYNRANHHWLPQSRQLPSPLRFYQMERAGELMRLLMPEINSSKTSGALEECRKLPNMLGRKLINYYAADFKQYGYKPYQ